MGEDPTAQDGSLAVNRGWYQPLSKIAFDFGVMEQQLPSLQKPWQPELQHWNILPTKQ
jgi:hypothetical protein